MNTIYTSLYIKQYQFKSRKVQLKGLEKTIRDSR